MQTNVQTLRKQLEAAETKLEHVSIVSEPEARTEDGLPVTNIYEELDEDGNVICRTVPCCDQLSTDFGVASKISKPGDAEPQLLQALQKAGLKKQDLASNSPVTPATIQATTNNHKDHASRLDKTRTAATDETLVSEEAFTPSTAHKAPVAKLTTSTPRQSQDPSANAGSNGRKPKEPSSFIQDVAKHSFPDGDRVVEVDSDDEEVSAIGPKSSKPESAADAALRARMLEYSLREVGNIVAQIDLDEAGTDVTDSGTEEFGSDEDFDLDGMDLDNDDEASSIEDEDEHGLSRNGNLSESYRKEMRELEDRLNARMFQSVGPSPDDTNEVSIATTEETIAPSAKSPATSSKPIKSAPKTAPKAKGVRFAETLDVAPTTPPADKSNKPASESAEFAQAPSEPAFKDTIIERRPAPSSTHTDSAQPKKVSRFKSSRLAATAQPEIQPHRSATHPLANTIIERPSPRPDTSKGPTTPTEADEVAPTVQRQQLASQYYRHRNQQVQKQGGFARLARDEEEREGDVSDDEMQIDGENGNGKKMSLFKKARIHGWDGVRNGL